jgi:23S rRNA pseudouridine2604 synthase
MRLNKYISSCGICSRREADKLIEEGRVLINGKEPAMGAKVEDGDVVTVDGRLISLKTEKTYIAYYKPVGVVCTRSDPHAKRTVADELSLDNSVTYAGRLDKDSEGLIIMTDDGTLIDAMMKSQNAHEKEYEVTTDKKVTDDFLKKMSEGVYIAELDRTTRPCKVSKTGENSFNIILTQGLNRQIRRMCAALDHKVLKLKRIRVLNVRLEDYDLKPGQYLNLSDDCVRELYRITGLQTEK